MKFHHLSVRKFIRRAVPLPGALARRRIEQHRDTGRYPKVPTIDATLDRILEGKLSVARYGDGEFNICFGEGMRFQPARPGLTSRLRDILAGGTTASCMVCIPVLRFNDTEFWNRYWYWNLGRLCRIVDPAAEYGNMGVSRQASVDQIRRFSGAWEGRSVVFVYGAGGRFDPGHELFAGIAAHVAVEGPAVGAWDRYEAILDEVLAAAGSVDDPVVVIALGPAATVLAYDLAERGVQALDLGHLTNVYDRLLNRGATPEELPIARR